MQKLQTVYCLAKSKGAGNQYKEQSVMTASPGDLVTMLYEAAIKNVKLSKIAIEEKNYDLSNRHLTKSQDIVDELIKGLDLKYGMANDLMQLYDYVISELVESNISKNDEKLDNVLDILNEMSDTWKMAVTSTRTQQLSV